MTDDVQIKDATANPAPLGLLGFGMTTILLNIHNSGIIPLDTMILGMGIFYGGIAQVIAGIMEWKKNNTFGTTAFTSYGFFWLSFAAMIILPKTGLTPASSDSVSFYLMFWGLFTFIMFIGTLKINRALQLVFGSLTVLFLLLVLAGFTANPAIRMAAGIEGIFCGLTAMYAGLAQVLNEVYGKTIWPVGPVKKAE